MTITRRPLLGAVTATLLLLAALGGPVATYAAEPDPTPAIEEAGGAVPTPAEPVVLDDGFEGEVVYDPFFVSPEPDSTPASSVTRTVARSTGAPRLTPPATDALATVRPAVGGASVPLLLAALAALSITVFALGRMPGARTR